MKLEQQVVSLELAKKLKELGVKQESLFVWVDKFPIFNPEIERLVSIREFKDRLAVSFLSEEARHLVKTYSAFTVAELGEMLPWMVCKTPPFLYLRCEKDHHGWVVQYQFMNEEPFEEAEDTEADARAKMLLYLLENKLI